MKKVKLTQGKYALVDDADFVRLNAFKWCCSNGYAMRRILKLDGKSKAWFMHWEILGKPSKGFEIDHRDMNRINNQRSNLRIATTSQNRSNRGKIKSNTSGFKGVSWHKRDKKWQANIQVVKKLTNLGNFSTAEEAYKAYCQACVKYHGEFANIS